jgi:putative glycosyltransferase (TIGR04372 family)
MKALIRWPLRLICRVVAVLVVSPLGYLLARFAGVRITPLFTARIGHLACNTQLYIADKVLNGDPYRRVFLGSAPSNHQLLRMFKRVIPVIDFRPFWNFYQYAHDILEPQTCFEPVRQHVPLPNGQVPFATPHLSLERTPSALSFTKSEQAAGEALLERMGLKRDDWFVCFQAKDSNYHAWRGAVDGTPHRNCNIETFLKAARHVTSLGGFAIRMGAGIDRPLPPTDDLRVIDYAKDFRSDFGDIFLFGNCRFYLGGSTGSKSVPPLFGRPIAIANELLQPPTPMGAHSLYIPKLLKYPEDGHLCSFREVVARLGGEELFVTALFDESRLYTDGYSLVDNSEDEILELCLDMLAQLDGTLPDAETRELQHLANVAFYGDTHPIAKDILAHGPRLGPSFARKYRHLIET